MGNLSIEIKRKIQNYYKSIFPHEVICKVLNINENKEIALEKEDGTFLRYETFNSPSAMKDRFSNLFFTKIHVGAIYDSVPRKLSTSKITGKELVFDIDLTDYPRECCSNQSKSMCVKCYQIIKVSVKLLNYILKEEFGFTEYGFVFSGRRGLHVWVLGVDNMKDSIRASIFKYFQTLIDKSNNVSVYDKIIKSIVTDKNISYISFYPRLDKQVTVNKKHLIKMVLSIHPDTLNIAIPLDPLNIKEFFELPTLDDFINDPSIMNEYANLLSTWKQSL